jgi:HPr kinase/phosphorylase
MTPQMGASANLHCCAVVISGIGVVIDGPPGSGKTSLALGLVDTALARGMDAALVSDDRAILERRAGILHASAPPQIAGLAEIRGFGIARMPHADECVVRLLCRLVADDAVERMPAPRRAMLQGVSLPFLELPRRHEAQAVRIVLAWIAQDGRPIE